MLPIRRVFYRAGLDQREIRILRGILRQFDYHIHRERQTYPLRARPNSRED